jgi:arylsulfatase A-like enzyme
VQRLAAALAVVLSLACGPERADRRPSFVLLLADDLGYGDLGSYGAPDLRTPHLDALARSGARFTAAYSASPVCSPTRAALLTGLYPQRLGHQFEDFLRPGTVGLDPARHVTIAERLRRAGYRTACFGKWNLQGGVEPGRSTFLPNAHGFEQWFGTRRNPDRFTHLDLRGRPDLLENGWPVSVEGYADELFAQRAVRFVAEAAAKGEPFFLYVPWLIPHYPLQAPDDPTVHPTGDRRTYVRMVEFLDDATGRILDALRAAGVESDTLVLFTSDNGGNHTSRTEPFRGAKSELTEGGIRVPLIASWPGRIPPGQEIATPTLTMDLAVTILAAAGLGEETRGMDGVDLLPQLTGAAAPAPRRLFWRRRSFRPVERIDRVSARALRDGDWKLLAGADGVQLYDLARDPREANDLAASEPVRVEALEQALSAWERDVDARPTAPLPAAP